MSEEGGTPWSSPDADPLGDMAAYAEEQKQLELRRLTGEPELDDQVAITGQYPPTGDTVWPPADNGDPSRPEDEQTDADVIAAELERRAAEEMR